MSWTGKLPIRSDASAFERALDCPKPATSKLYSHRIETMRAEGTTMTKKKRPKPKPKGPAY